MGEHSELLMHSGRQFGGFPKNSGRHEQEGALFVITHWLLGPQGDGSHRFLGGSGSLAIN